MNEKKIAKITGVRLEIEDHGILTIGIGLDYGGVHQTYGGYGLDSYDKKTNERIGTRYGTECILRLIRAFGTTTLEEITGRYCYAHFASSTYNELVEAIETLEPDGSVRFSFKEIAEELKEE